MTAPAPHPRRTTPPGRYSVQVRRAGEQGPELVTLYDPQPRQDAMHGSPAPNILYGGQAGGGKSHALRWHGIMNALRVPGLKALLLRRELTDLQKSHLLELPVEIAALLESGAARWNEQKKTLTVFHPNGLAPSVVVFGSCQYEKDIGAYLSSQWDLILIDEASLFTPRMLRMLRTRLRTTLPGVRTQFVCGTNPGGEGHLWLYERFIAKRPTTEPERGYNPAEWAYIPSALEDNQYLDAAEYDRQFSSLDDNEYAAYRKGLWDAFAGQFFRAWDRSVHVVPRTRPIPEWWTVAAGMDWGWDPSPGYVGWAAFDEYGRAWGYQELVFTESTPRDVARMIAARCQTDAERSMTIYGDTQMWTPQATKNGVSIADEINAEFADLGVGIVLEQANKDRLNGWARFKQWLSPKRQQPKTEGGGAGPWLRFLDGAGMGDDQDDSGEARGCPYLINTIGAQLYDDRMNGDMKKGATDHGCDAWRYLLMAQEPLTAVPVAVTGFATPQERRSAYVAARMRAAQRQHEEAEALLAAEAVGAEIVLGGYDETGDDDRLGLDHLAAEPSVADLFR